MYEEKIIKVTEAFSMQPIVFEVGINGISHIVTQYSTIDSQLTDLVVGYDYDDNKVFEYHRKSVNLQFG